MTWLATKMEKCFLHAVSQGPLLCAEPTLQLHVERPQRPKRPRTIVDQQLPSQ